MTTKPDWSTAPEWANFLAHDIDGWWIWYETEPTLYADGSWYSRHRSLLVDKQLGDASIETRNAT